MPKLLKYFYPSKKSSYFDELRIGFFISICFFGVVFISLHLLSDIYFTNSNFVVSFTSKIATLILLVGFLFLLKRKGINVTGNVFSITMLVLLLVFINIIPDNVLPISKFIQGFYSVYAYIMLALIFANRKVLILNSVLILISTTHVYIWGIASAPDNDNLLTSAFINHTVILVLLTITAYYISLFIEKAIEKANDEITQREFQNQELITSEEEIRAANEELVATTDALIEANNDLTKAKNKAEESDRLKTEFLNNMSHEVRTPMNGIIGFSQLLDMPDIKDEQRKTYITTIQQSSNQLLSIIDNIIEISKLGTKQVKVFEEIVNLNNLLEELFSVFKINAKSKKVEFLLKTALPDEKCRVLVDQVKLYKILSNLLENAFKFTEVGSVEFGYTVEENGTDESLRNFVFYVRDTGIGIDLESQVEIFEKFSQAESGVSRYYGGLGLGLSIAKENTLLLNGSIELNSERGKGSEFIVAIPLKVV